MGKPIRHEMQEGNEADCDSCGEVIKAGEKYFMRAGKIKHDECAQTHSSGGVLNRVMKVNEEIDKRDFGRANLQVQVLRRFMTSEQLAKFNEQYNQALIIKSSPRDIRPPEEDILLFEEHLKPEYSHLTFSEFARKNGENPQNFAQRMYRVAYWKHVVKKEV